MKTIDYGYEKGYIADMEFLTRLSISLTSNHNYHTNITDALRMIGKHYGNDRIHILKIHPDMTFSIPYEWCHHTVSPICSNFKKQKCFYEQELIDQLNTHNYIKIGHPEQITNKELKTFFTTHSILCSLILPLLSRNFFAFIAFNQCQQTKEWQEYDIHILSLLAAIIAANLEKNTLVAHLMQQLSEREKKSKQPIPNKHTTPLGSGK